MHTLLATFFTALFSFCHASSVRQASVNTEAATRNEAAYNIQYAPPSRHQFAQAQFRSQFESQMRGGYAERECLSCRKTNAVYYTR